MRSRTPPADLVRWGLQLCALGLVAAVCSLACAQSDSDGGEPDGEPVTWEVALRSATDAYVEADYASVVTLLAPHTDNDSIPEERRVRLLRLISLAHILQVPPDAAAARVVMEKLLSIEPNFRYLEGLAPPEASALLDDVRASMGLPGDGAGPGPAGGGETIYVERSVRRRVRWAAFIPFGVGHFQNGWNVLGYTFAGLESAALVTNVTMFLAVEGLRGPSGFYTRDDRAIARDLQFVQFGSLFAAVGLMVVDVVVANLLFVPEDVDVRTLEGPPPELTLWPTTEPFAAPAVTRFLQLRSDF